VRIVDDRLPNFNGTVEEIDGDHSRLKVSVTIFGAFNAGGTGFCERREAGLRRGSLAKKDYLRQGHG